MFDSTAPSPGAYPRNRNGQVYFKRHPPRYLPSPARKKLTRYERETALTIREQRYKRKLTLGELAAASSVHHTSISAFECLRIRLREDQIDALRRALRAAKSP
jgi:hypothetical protein